MNDSFANNLAAIFFLVCFVPAWFAWRKTRYLGTVLPPFNRAMQRLAFSAAILFGCFGFLVYAAWKLGTVFGWPGLSGRGLSLLLWLPLGLILWAALTYRLLKWRTLMEGRGYEKPS